MKRFLSLLLPSRLRRRLKLDIGLVDHESRLQNLKRCGFNPDIVVDGGAYRGEWTATLHRVYPSAKVLLIEPQPKYAAALRQSTSLPPGSVVFECALGLSSGVVDLQLGDSNSYLVAKPSGNTIQVNQSALDEVIAQTRFPQPALIKLDVQGSELVTLQGANRAVRHAEVICLELSLLRIGEVPLFHEVLGFLESSGFRLYDLYGQNYRPLDGALWQVDAIFVKHDSPLLSSRQWG